MSDLEKKSRNLSIISIAVVLIGVVASYFLIITDTAIPADWFAEEYQRNFVISSWFGISSVIGIVGIIISLVSLFSLSLGKSKKILLYVLWAVTPVVEIVLFVLSRYYGLLLPNV